MTMDNIARIIKASISGHDQPRLETEQDRLITSLRIGLQTTPNDMSQRLQRLLLEGQRLKLLDLDNFIDAVRPVVTNDPILQADLAALELVAARLGSDLMAMRIGRQIFEELRQRRALPAGRLP